MILRSTWTDSRLDDLSDRVKGMDAKIDRLDGRIDKLNHTLVQGMIALISVIAVLLAAFLTVVVTHF
jgi:hypothetical protein